MRKDPENVADAADPGARVLIAECIIGKPNERSMGTLLDLLMLVALTGRERTAAEYEELLEASGFRLTSVHDTPSAISVLEAVRQ